MTHWITPVHETNRSCVDVKGERKRLVPRRVLKTKFPTKLRGRGWNNLINSPKTRMCPNAHWHETRSSCARLPWLGSPCLGVFFFFCTLSSPTTVKACRGGNHTTTATPSPGRPGRNTHTRAHGRPSRRVTSALLEFTRSSSVYRVKHREIKRKVKENRKRRKAMKL